MWYQEGAKEVMYNHGQTNPPSVLAFSRKRNMCRGKREKAADRSNDTNNHIVTKVIISSLFVFMVMTVSNVRICNDTQSQ